MIRTILSIALLSAVATASLQADPKSSKKSSSHKNKQTTASKTDATTPVTSGWSYTNGVWTHIDGYKLVNGQVLRSGIQTHKNAPKPPTKAEMDAVMKKANAPKTAAQVASEKAAQRERNLTPKPAPQTGSHF
jgi:hypothetical protein